MHKLLVGFLAIASLLWGLFKPSYPIDHAMESIARFTGTITAGFYAGAPDTCTAFAIADRRFLTADHCVMGSQDFELDGNKVTVTKEDPWLDLAILVADIKKPALEVSTSPVYLGDELISIGYAYGMARPTVLWHRVTHYSFSPWLNAQPGIVVTPEFIEGMSGGPVIDTEGKVVMVVQQSNEPLGYGVGAADIVKFIN